MRGAAVLGRADPGRLAALNVLRACAATFGSDGAHGVILDDAGTLVAAPLAPVTRVPASSRTKTKYKGPGVVQDKNKIRMASLSFNRHA